MSANENITDVQRRRLLGAGAWGLGLSTLPRPALAQGIGENPIKIISPYPPGGGTDGFARAIGQNITGELGSPVLVENHGGANGTIGAALTAKSKPDGTTMMIVAAGYAAGVSLYKDLPYDQRHDLTGIALLASGPLVLVVHPSMPVNTVPELIEYVRKRPGQVSYASSGIGSLPHLCTELFCSMTGIKMIHVPYKGPSASLPDVLSGRVPVYFNAIFYSLPLIRSGKLRALAVSTPEPSPLAPNIPALAQNGVPGFNISNWYGMVAPSHTPAATIARLNQAINKALTTKELETMATSGGMNVQQTTAEYFQQFLLSETDKYNRLVKTLGLSSAAA